MTLGVGAAPTAAQADAAPVAAGRAAAALQARIKALFDPHGRFPELAARPDGDNL